MKTLITTALLILFVTLSVPASYAAFPIHTQQATATANVSAPSESVATLQQNLQVNEIERTAPAVPTPATGGKSQMVALILAIFLGWLGIHRFYLGYIWQGVVQLLTFGGFGIWWLIDIIRIATGDLKPKNGSYSETL